MCVYAMRLCATEQKDVDLAFADYDDACLTLKHRPISASSNTVLHRCCDCPDYTYNCSGANEPGACVCNKCGTVQPGNIIFEQMFGRVLSKRTSNYKRIHHWHERISQFMLMESQIPAEHILAIGERLLDGSYTIMSKDSIRTVLRSLGLQVYIEKWLQIIQRCTGVMPPFPGPIVLQRLDQLFTELQRPFLAHKLHGRRNFLNYNYVFCRLFQRMNCPKFCMFFPLIRSKAKLRALDEMWTPMASSLGWETPPLQQVATFAVKIEQPALLLERLKDQVASSSQAAPPKARERTAYQKWDHRSELPVRFEKAALRSERLERKPQTIALRLKRKRNE